MAGPGERSIVPVRLFEQDRDRRVCVRRYTEQKENQHTQFQHFHVFTSRPGDLTIRTFAEGVWLLYVT
jgi:hypothetical protein